MRFCWKTVIAALLLLPATGCREDGPVVDEPGTGTASTSTAASPSTGASPAGTTSDPEGAALYANYCAACHGADGRSAVEMASTPDLNSQGLLTAVDDAFLYAAIAQGRPGRTTGSVRGTKMPAFGPEGGSILDDGQIQAIVRHIRSWQTEPSVALEAYVADGDAAAGAEVYAEYCASCHGADGWGEAAPRLAGQAFQAAAGDAFIRHTIRNGRPGTAMAAYNFTDAEMDGLVAFIRTLGPMAGDGEGDG